MGYPVSLCTLGRSNTVRVVRVGNCQFEYPVYVALYFHPLPERERDRERDRDTDTERETQRETDTDTDRKPSFLIKKHTIKTDR